MAMQGLALPQLDIVFHVSQGFRHACTVCLRCIVQILKLGQHASARYEKNKHSAQPTQIPGDFVAAVVTNFQFDGLGHG